MIATELSERIQERKSRTMSENMNALAKEAIERMYYGLSVIEETHPDTAKAMSEFLSLLESTILDLTEKVRVRDEAIDVFRKALVRLSNEVSGSLYLEEQAIRELWGNTNFHCMEQALNDAKAALDAAKEKTS